jgi:ribosomal protein L27
VLRQQNGQDNQRSVLTVELRDGDIQLEGDNLCTQRISRKLFGENIAMQTEQEVFRILPCVAGHLLRVVS